ncbi:3261_t:CDS:1, partial [Cetraspora pellucida]
GGYEELCPYRGNYFVNSPCWRKAHCRICAYEGDLVSTTHNLQQTSK